jgi:tetratricopeptide (TPR) repeat protein
MFLPTLSGCDFTVTPKDGGTASGSFDGVGAVSGEINSAESILELAKLYFTTYYASVEGRCRMSLMRLFPEQPDFTGGDIDEGFVSDSSLAVALTVFLSDAKNYSVVTAAGMIAKDPYSVTAATNFAAAVAAYHDAQDFISLSDFTGKNSNGHYKNAEKIYLYAIGLSKEDGKYTPRSLTPLASLGNLYIDMGKSGDALKLFDEALKIDPYYTPAITGRRTALFDLGRFDELELFLGAATKQPQSVQEEQRDHIAEWLQEVMIDDIIRLDNKVHSDASVDQLAEYVKQEAAIEVISKADALTHLSAETEREIRARLKETQENMKFEAPDLAWLNYTSDWKEFYHAVYPNVPSGNDIVGEAASEWKTKYEEYREKQEQREEEAKRLYPKQGMEFVGPGIDENLAGLMFLALYYKRAAPIAMNPFDYTNPEDVLIQRAVITGYEQKFSLFSKYMSEFEDEMRKDKDDAFDSYIEIYIRLCDEYSDKKRDLSEKYAGRDDEASYRAFKSEMSSLALGYYNRAEAHAKESWKDAMNRAKEWYSDFCETLPIMYKDIMSYIMLVSDKELQAELEAQLNSWFLRCIYKVCDLLRFFAGVGSSGTEGFDENGRAEKLCNSAASHILSSEEAGKVDAQELENAQRRYADAMKGKAAFDAKILDENSSYYKNRIEKYEYSFNYLFIKGTVNDYKETTTFGFNAGVVSADISQTVYNYTGNVKMSGSLELGAGKGFGDNLGVSAAAKFGWQAGIDGNGNIIPNSVDIRAGVEGGVNAFKVIDAKGGIEASVMRGTKTYGDIGLTANEIMKDLRTKAWEKRLGREMSDMEKDAGIFAMYHNNFKLPDPPKFWSGEYVITPPAGTIKLPDKK